MSRGKSDKSRHTTPWTGREDVMTPAEKLTHYTFVQNYTDLHPPLGDSLEVGFINLYPVNHTHFLLKSFLNAHSGFDRDELSGYLNLFAFIMNPPDDYLEKVAKILDLGFQNPKTLKYRDVFGVNSGI